jgi:hypothetical protein
MTILSELIGDNICTISSPFPLFSSADILTFNSVVHVPPFYSHFTLRTDKIKEERWNNKEILMKINM